MLLNEDILRFMTIRVDELEAEPSIMMRNKGAREDRPRRDDRDRDRSDERSESDDDNSGRRSASSDDDKEGAE